MSQGQRGWPHGFRAQRENASSRGGRQGFSSRSRCTGRAPGAALALLRNGMSTGIWSAASGAVGQIAGLDSAAQNIANAATPGYRAEEAVFRQSLVKSIDSNTGTKSLRYAVSRTTVPDFRAGQMVQTGRPLDVAITDDKSFFVVSTPKGERYTRAGSFRMAVDGTLTTPDGYPVLGANRRPIKIDPNARYVGPSGESVRTNVSLDREGSLTVDGSPGPKLALVTFKNLGGLERDGQVLFRAQPAAGNAMASDALLETASLEQSNANAVTGMTTLVNSSRNFEMISKVIEAFGEIDKRAASGIMGK
jgi:flagellar basal-body rod protein FlgF